MRAMRTHDTDAGPVGRTLESKPSRRPRLPVSTLALLLTCIAHGPAAGEDLAALPLEDLLRLEVTAASRFPQTTREAPAAVTVITRDQIRDHAWHTLADALDAIPGLFVTTDRVYRYLGVRGFLQPSDYNANVLLLIDGVPANDAVYNQAFLGTEGLLDMALIERIEFIPGPGSSVYGSNAILGVINVVTASGRSLRGTRAEVSAQSRDGRGAALRHGYADDRRDLLLSVGAWRSDGETVTLPDTERAAYGRADGLDHDRNRRLMARYAWGELLLLGTYVERRKGYATAPYETLFGDPRTFARDRQLLVSLAHSGEALPGISLLTRLSLGGAEYRAEWPYPLADGGLNRDDSRSRWWGAELQATDVRLERHTVIYGLEYRDEFELRQRNADRDPPPGAVRFDDSRSARHVGVYVQDEWSTAAWRINAGVRADHYSSFGSTLNPRLGLVHLVSPATTVKYLAGTAYRAPNVYEMHYHDGNDTMKANPDLRPERIRSLEVALEHVTTAGWQWGGSLFHNRIRDLIAQEVDPADGLLVYRNRGDASIRGAVLSLHRQWTGGTRLALSSSWHDARDSASGERLTHTPRRVSKFDVTVPLGIWRATLEARHLGRRATGAGHVGGLAWGNLALVSARPVLGGGQFALRIDDFTDRNLADPASEEFDHDRLPREGRTARITLAWRL